MNLLNIPLEDNFRTTLTGDLIADATALSLPVASVPAADMVVGQKLRITINARRGFTYMEEVLVESIDYENNILEIAVGGRAQDRYNGDTPTPLLHRVGDEVIISNPYGLWLETQSAINSKLGIDGGTMTGPLSIVAYANAAARDAAITSPVNGMEVYLISEGYFTDRVAGAWVQRGTGAVAIGADHSAGKLDIANQTEMQNGTQTDATSGAPNTVCVNMTAETSTGAGDYGKLPRANSSGKLDNSWLNLPGLGVVPAGTIVPYAGDTAPSGFLLADGSSVSKTTYSALFLTSGVGITYGNGANNSLASATFTADAGTDVITSAAHGLTLNSTITVSTSGSLPSGLSAATTYFVITVTTNTFQLSATKGGAAINITSAGTGTQTWTAQLIVDATDDTVYLAAHGLVNNQIITFTSAGVLPTGITAGVGYYVINKTNNTFQISATSGGSAINITAGGTPTHSIQVNFLLPNMKGQVPVGRDAAQTEFDVLGETGGAKTHTHTPGTLFGYLALAANIIQERRLTGLASWSGSNNSNQIAPTGAISSQANSFTEGLEIGGVSGSTSNLVPYTVLNYIIKT